MTAPATATLADIANAARSLAGAQRTKQVTDPEIGQWANEALARLYDELVLADDSYYSTDYDFTAGAGSESAATTALPADFYKMRGLTRWPDTPRAVTITSQPFANRNQGAPGYLLRGNSITIVPWRLTTMAGPYRISYVQYPPRFGRPLDIETVQGDGIVAGFGPYGLGLSVYNGHFSAVDDQASLVLFNAVNAIGNNVNWPAGLQMDWSGTPSSPVTTARLVGITHGGPDGTATEAFTADTFAMVVHAGEIYRLDTLLDPFRQYVINHVAAKILEKKKQDASAVWQMAGDELARVQRSASIREGEPEAVPVLWAPRSSRFIW